MNGKITQALSAKETGDILKYFEEVDKIINLNDGIHDNKMLSMECYDRPTPVKYNQYTKFHISDAGVELFTTMFIKKNENHYDRPKRMFYSISHTWDICMNSTQCNIEFIPEFFYIHHFFVNENSFEFNMNTN